MGRFSFLFTTTSGRLPQALRYSILGLLVLVLALSVGYAVLPQFWGQAPTVQEQAREQAPPDAVRQQAPQTPVKTETRPENTAHGPYEEALGSALEQNIKHVDHAIVSAFVNSDMQPGRMYIENVECPALSPDTNVCSYHFQRIILTSKAAPASFLERLGEELQGLATSVSLEKQGPDAWRIVLDSLPTHELRFSHPDVATSPPERGEGQLAIVMDDLGLSVHYARQLAELPVKVTFSVLPRLPHSRDVAMLAKEFGLELMLHQPMQPLDESVNPGPGALKDGMKPSTLRRIMELNLMDVPGVTGLNNHMGSRLTQNQGAMQAVVDVARRHGLFVLDSLTHPGTVLASTAEASGVPVVKRDVFLDVVRETKSVLFQLQKAERLARSRGQAVAIGHPFPETLEALRIWSSREHEGVEVVAASRVLELAAERPLALSGDSR